MGSPTCPSPPDSPLPPSVLLKQQGGKDGASQGSQGLKPQAGSWQRWGVPRHYHGSPYPCNSSAVPRDPHAASPHLPGPGWPPLMASGCCQAVAAYFQALLVPWEGECEERGPVHPACSCPATRRLRIDLVLLGPRQHRGAAGCGTPPSHLPAVDSEDQKKMENGFLQCPEGPRTGKGNPGRFLL